MLSPNVLLAAIAVLHVTATNQPTASVIEADATGRAHEGGHHTKKKKGKAFYALFEPMLRNAEWPSAYGHFRDGVFILDPFNVTSATVKKIKADLNATVLMYWDTNDMLMKYSHGQCMSHTTGQCGKDDATGTLYPECSAGAVKCCTSFNCSLAKAPLCAADAFPEAIAKVFDPEWSVRLLSNQTTTTNNHHLERGTDDTGTGGVETAAVPQCLYYFGLNYVPFEKSVAAVGAFLVEWVKEHAYDGVYLDEYFSAEVFERVFTRAGSGLFAGKGNHYDTDGDGRADSLDQIQAQYVKFRNGLSAILRKQLGPNAILIANTAGAGDDPNLNGITLEMEACIDPTECIKWLKDQEKIGAQPAMSIIWTCDGQAMKPEQQCANAAEFQTEMDWLHVGTAWYDGPRIVC